jgi:TolB-like protein/class 3 adenylate cyclase
MSQFRQLVAIMFTDIVGYTALMGNDEQKAFEVLVKNRELQKPLIELYNGKWIKELGDGVMASFNSVSDAVNAAIKIQEACNAANDFKLRIGIHQGEVVFENDDMFGDGVNIAARIQAIAYPGSIFISETVHDIISNKKEFKTKFVNEVGLKNVKNQVKIYQIIGNGIIIAPATSLDKHPTNIKKIVFAAFAAIIIIILAYHFNEERQKIEINDTENIEEKSIAVLPFVDMSETKDQEYLSDGIAEEIINSITAIKSLKVIGRTSSYYYKGKGLDAQAIGEKLKVNTILEGSVQKSGDNLRIIIKLIRVKDNSTIWSQQFNKKIKDIFAIQDSIANHIVQILKLTLTDSEKPRLVKKETDTEVYTQYLKGLLFYKKNEFSKSIEYNLRAISIDSLFAPSYAYVALAKTWTIYKTRSFLDFIAIREAKEFAVNAIRLDPNLSEGYSALALSAWAIELDFEAAKLNFKKSIELNSSSSLTKNRYAYFLLWMGDFDQAEKLGLEGISSDPADYNGYVIVASSNIYKRNFTKAEKYINEGRKIFPENLVFEYHNILSLFYSGNYNQVIKSVENYLKTNPNNIDETSLAFLSISYLKNGDVQKSKNILHQLEGKAMLKNSEVNYNLARIYSQYNMKDSCFQYLKIAFDNRESNFSQLKIDPLFEQLRKDQRYLQLYHQYGFDRYN